MSVLRWMLVCILCAQSIFAADANVAQGNRAKGGSSENEPARPWLVVDGDGSAQEGLDVGDFPQLLVMQLAKADAFRCVEMRDADFLKQSEVLSSVMASGERVSCVSWVIRKRDTPRGMILTVSIGYRKLFKTGRGELLKSQDLLVREQDLKGIDLMTFVAKKAAKAILFELRQPIVLEIESSGKVKMAVVDYGRNFFEKGDEVEFMRRKIKDGRTLTRKVGSGVVSFTDIGATTIAVKSGKVEERDFVMPIEEDVGKEEATAEAAEKRRSEVCSTCKGRCSIRVRTDCADCNGQGKRLHIKGRSRDLRSCTICGGRGWRSFQKTCPECSGTGRATARPTEERGDGVRRSPVQDGSRGAAGKQGDFTF